MTSSQLSLLVLVASVCIPAAWAQAITTPSEAFNAGAALGNAGATSAGGMVNSIAGSANLPNYSTSAPQSSLYGGGTGPVGAAGAAKQIDCQTSVASTGMAQQECNAVNFLSRNPGTRPQFIIDKRTDPILTGSNATIRNPGAIPGASTQQCRVVDVTTPATFTTEACVQSVVVDSVSCSKTLVPQCAYQGGPLASTSTAQSGIFSALQITPTGTPGLYDYILAGGGHSNDGWAQIDFSLDTVNQGGYITVNVSGLDDAAAIGVNGYTVYAGYPNSGPQYGDWFFPQNTAAFQIGYSWSEATSAPCVAVDADGVCSAYGAMTYQSFYANTKLLDFCPGGYTPTTQAALAPIECVGDGQCYAGSPQGYTPYNVSGFFCNPEGKFLMNRREGNDAAGASLSSQMPLLSGANKIQVYWGTGPGNGGGGVTVTGQIYNVAPVCTTLWNDGCAGMRAAQ